MKNSILMFLFAVVLVLSGCGTPRKIQKNDLNDIEILTHDTETKNRLVDTTESKSGKISIVEIEFTGDPPRIEPKGELCDPAPPRDPPTIETDNVKITGSSIKSAKITTIEAQEEKKGLSEDKISSEKKGSKLEHNENAELEEPTKDPNRFKWIFFIMLLAFIVLVWIKRSSLWGIIKKMLHL